LGIIQCRNGKDADGWMDSDDGQQQNEMCREVDVESTKEIRRKTNKGNP
jgi:hypothetical protein